MKQRNIRKGFLKQAMLLAAIILSLFHLYTAGFGILTSMKQRTFHLGLILFLVFLLFPATSKAPKDRVPWYDVILAISALATNFYIFYMCETVASGFNASISEFNFWVGIIALLLLLEGARRATGIELTTLSLISIFYMRFGYLFPGFFKFRGVSTLRIVEVMAWSNQGVYGLVLGVSATFIYTFILFGALISKTGVGILFSDLAQGICGRTRGGGAKVAVVSSALMGTISGSAVANVVTTGTFTIPLMAKLGYSPIFAAAVEAVSSTGGQLMPPIMGAAAFIMAGLLGIPYLSVVRAAIIPALLYFFGLFFAVHLRALDIGLKGLNKEDIPSIKAALKQRGNVLIPIIILIVLLVRGFSPLFCVFYSIVAAIVVSAINKMTRISLNDFINVLIEGAHNSLSVATACGVVGFTVGMVGATGIGLALGAGIIGIAGDNLFICLILVGIISLFLGAGIPPTACYIVVAVISAPILVNFFDIQPLIAHLFVFYYGMLAVITPPVALASFTAAGIVGESFYKVGWEAFKLGSPSYIIPFIFITSPSLLFFNFTIVGLVVGLFRGIIMVIAMATSMQGYIFGKIGYPVRILLLISSILIMYTSVRVNIIGIVISSMVIFIDYLRMKRIVNLQKEGSKN